jgi:hypothetical protein
MAFSALTTAEVQAGEPVKQSLQTKIKDNFDNHEDRITANAVSLDNKYGGSMFNVGAAYSVAADALTITLKQQDGSTDPTAGSPARVAVRSASATSATYAIIDVESGIALTVPKGATLGGLNNISTRYYLYVLSNAGTPELAVSGQKYEDEIVTTVAISAASDTRATIYSNTARANVPIRRVGFFEVTTTTSGDWITPTLVYTGIYGLKRASIGTIGDIRTSMLTLAQFQAINGTSWVLANGASCSSTAYGVLTGNSTLPDFRGEFIRGLDNGRGVDSGRTMGSAQAQATAVNGLHDNGHTHTFTNATGGGTLVTPGGGTPFTSNTTATGYADFDSTDSETRPRNVSANIFIKVEWE